MPQENTELVRQLYEAGPEVERLLLDGSDLADHPWLAFWHPDCVLEEIADVPDAAAYRGLRACRPPSGRSAQRDPFFGGDKGQRPERTRL